MVINNYKGGRLGNRIILFSHFIVNSIEHGYSLVNIEFDEYNPYFEATSKNHFNNYPISISLFKNHFADRVFSVAFRLWADITYKLFTATPFYKLYRIFKSHGQKGILFDLNDPLYVSEARSRIVIVQGWVFRDYNNINKHSDLLRQFFAPVEKYRIEIEALMREIRATSDVVIGVHIRKGDYDRFEAGKYLYTDAMYAEKMMQVYNQMAAKGKTCAFLICSNEKINLSSFPDELIIHAGARHFMIDLYSLASCDGIIGPPSTFSTWASFYGKVPLTQIYSKDENIQIGAYDRKGYGL